MAYAPTKHKCTATNLPPCLRDGDQTNVPMSQGVFSTEMIVLQAAMLAENRWADEMLHNILSNAS